MSRNPFMHNISNDFCIRKIGGRAGWCIIWSVVGISLPFIPSALVSLRLRWGAISMVHMIVLNERHLRRVLKEYLAYYHRSLTHLGLGKDAPVPRAIQAPGLGPVVAEPVLGGLHHRYYRQAA